MSKTKSRTPCFVAGCSVVAVIFIVVVVMLGMLFFHIPAAKKVSDSMSKDSKMHTVLVEAGDTLDTAPLSEQSRGIYDALQSQYQVENAATDENGEKTSGAAFPCSAIVEYYTEAAGESGKSEVYGMIIYTDTILTAYDVFTTYYRLAGDQGTDFSSTEYFLFVRGNAIFVGNNKAFLKAYMGNLF